MFSETHEQMALDYLRAVLGEDAPRSVAPVATFDEAPLAGEGKVTVFAFQAGLGGNPDELFYVVAGQTVANYYPQWGLDADQIYSVHLGTRFMLVVEVQQLPVDRLPADLPAELRQSLADYLPGEPVEEIVPLATFTAEGQTHAVCRARIGGEEVYVMGADLPLGMYKETHLPAHVTYRWHLGNIIRLERPEA